MATSREHRHKKTDFIEVFGKNPNAIVIRDEKGIDVQGPKSKLLKFPKVLCHSCNTTKSQPFDYAYDTFIKYIQKNRDQIIKNGEIDFKEIFPDNSDKQKQNVLRYYIKHICCRLASNDISINQEIIDFLNGKGNLQNIYIKFEIRMDLVFWIERLKKRTADPGNLYISPLSYFTKSKGSDEIEVVYGFYTYRWLKMLYFYSDKMIENNYPGYTKYNLSTTIPVQALYIIDPNKYETLTDDELSAEITSARDNYSDNNLIKDNLGTNPFME